MAHANQRWSGSVASPNRTRLGAAGAGTQHTGTPVAHSDADGPTGAHACTVDIDPCGDTEPETTR